MAMMMTIPATAVARERKGAYARGSVESGGVKAGATLGPLHRARRQPCASSTRRQYCATLAAQVHTHTEDGLVGDGAPLHANDDVAGDVREAVGIRGLRRTRHTQTQSQPHISRSDAPSHDAGASHLPRSRDERLALRMHGVDDAHSDVFRLRQHRRRGMQLGSTPAKAVAASLVARQRRRVHSRWGARAPRRRLGRRHHPVTRVRLGSLQGTGNESGM